MKAFLARHWFLLALAAVLAVGVSQSSVLEPLAELRAVRYGIVAAVLFVMALPIDARAMTRSLRRPGPPLLGVAINFGILPLVAWGSSFMFNSQLAGGIYVAAATPCPLASAAVWTRRAGGNDSVAILVTVITNVSCFVVTPVWLFWMTGELPDVAQLRLPSMIVKLGLIVVLPMALAQLLRRFELVRELASRRRVALSIAAQSGVLSMVLLGAIRMGVKLLGEENLAAQMADFLVVSIYVVAIHLSMLGLGFWLSLQFRFDRQDAIAVGIAGSQKTLMVGLQTAIELNLSILPIVAYHVGQLLLDTVIADRWRRRESLEKPTQQGTGTRQPAGPIDENGPCE